MGGREGYEASKGILTRESKGGRDEIFKDEEEDGKGGPKKFKHLQVIRHPDLTRFDSLYSATSRGRGRETSRDELQEVPGERQGESTPPSCVNFRLQYSYSSTYPRLKLKQLEISTRPTSSLKSLLQHFSFPCSRMKSTISSFRRKIPSFTTSIPEGKNRDKIVID